MRAFSFVIVTLTILSWPALTVAEDSAGTAYTSIKLLGAYAQVKGIEAAGSLSGPIFPSNDESDGKDLEDLIGGITAAVGYDFGRYRLELEYGWRYRFDLNGNVGRADPGPGRTATFRSEVESQTLLLSLLWDFETDYSLLGYRLQPWAGIGVGVVKNKTDTNLFNFGISKERDTNTEKSTAWLLTAGSTVKLNERWSADIAYRYIDLGDVHIGPQSGGAEVSTSGMRSHDLTFGLIYRF
ncbi:porin family protein [Motiliproteus coralliicola]|uniref:Porin family protein n=1 Tax=Motiliproteus coralliicola TaxID=2283196 RepID=A0A369WH19_9GAMM|nr:outer membrane beta-barrel protein [Motiliproteus coralliicola]RDE18745.1 porin family protein [Motiliproteus coralliicola]